MRTTPTAGCMNLWGRAKSTGHCTQSGYLDTRITHRFVRMTPDENRHTNPVRFIDASGKTIYTQPAAYNEVPFDFSRVAKLGKGYMTGNDSLVHAPFDFTERNKLPLETLQQLLQSTLFPQSVPAKQQFNLTDDDYRFLYQYLSQYPGETNYPKYDPKQYYDSYVKFFFMDSLHHQMPARRSGVQQGGLGIRLPDRRIVRGRF